MLAYLQLLVLWYLYFYMKMTDEYQDIWNMKMCELDVIKYVN